MAVREVKLCLLGESGVGKSSIAVRFVHDNFRPAMESTIGASFLTKNMHVEGNSFKFQIWDTAGQEKYRALAPMYYRGAQAAIIVYDITREESFKTLRAWVLELQRHGPPNIAIAIAGNKADLEELREVKHRASEYSETCLEQPHIRAVALDRWSLITDALNYAEGIGAILVETSAKTAININVLFHELCRKLAASDDFLPKMDGPVIKPRKQEPQKEKKNCAC